MAKKIIYPNYEACITNAACSIMQHFGLQPPHKTLPFLDEILQKNYKNVVMLVFDGLGAEIIKQNLPADSFLARHMQHTVTSVFPPTTTAATTSLRSGLNPCEHGRIGYHVYISELKKIVTLFKNKIKDTDEVAAPYDVMTTLLPAEDITVKINRAGLYKAYGLFPFGEDAFENMEDMFERIRDLCRTSEKKYIYAYHEQPDELMHLKGTNAPEVKKMISQINTYVEKLATEVRDTLIIVTADHGHLNNQEIALQEEYPEFSRLIEGNISVEGRACSFRVMPENQAEFVRLFQQLFGKDFILLSKKEVLEKQLFGDGKPHPNLEASLGDFLAIGIGEYFFEMHKRKVPMFSHHAGLLKDEMMVPLIIVEK